MKLQSDENRCRVDVWKVFHTVKAKVGPAGWQYEVSFVRGEDIAGGVLTLPELTKQK